MAEIWPVGGAGDRLGLVCGNSGEPLPAALLPYTGRTMMEGLLRDLQVRSGRACAATLVAGLLAGWLHRGGSAPHVVLRPWLAAG